MEGYRPCCVTRTFKYLSDARTVTASIEEVLKVSFDRYVPAHGAIIETGAQAALREGSLAMFQSLPNRRRQRRSAGRCCRGVRGDHSLAAVWRPGDTQTEVLARATEPCERSSERGGGGRSTRLQWGAVAGVRYVTITNHTQSAC